MGNRLEKPSAKRAAHARMEGKVLICGSLAEIFFGK
jgi:hypothetical protein